MLSSWMTAARVTPPCPRAARAEGKRPAERRQGGPRGQVCVRETASRLPSARSLCLGSRGAGSRCAGGPAAGQEPKTASAARLLQPLQRGGQRQCLPRVLRDISSRESVRRGSPSQKASETCLYKEKLMYGFFFVFNELNTINSSRGFTLTTCSYTQFAHNLCVINIPIHYYSMCTHRNLY